MHYANAFFQRCCPDGPRGNRYRIFVELFHEAVTGIQPEKAKGLEWKIRQFAEKPRAESIRKK